MYIAPVCESKAEFAAIRGFDECFAGGKLR
jgi:hypothetical protein